MQHFLNENCLLQAHDENDRTGNCLNSNFKLKHVSGSKESAAAAQEISKRRNNEPNVTTNTVLFYTGSDYTGQFPKKCKNSVRAEIN